ncbi:MAG: SIR2 family protein [Pseudomonadota bacterium]
MADITPEALLQKLESGQLIPFLGAGSLKNVTNTESGAPIPADSDSLILAMTGGQPMAPRLMYEFPRAAMHLENKKGRTFIERFLNELYSNNQWSVSQLHKWLGAKQLPLIIDINRDEQLTLQLSETPHYLIVGVARIAAHPLRFDIYKYVDGEYSAIEQDDFSPDLPILFKPLGCPQPTPSFIASDADFVDYITELMGGFAIPTALKSYRKGKQYLFMGMRFTRDTERMVMSEIIYAADEEIAGWAFIAEPTDKERRFLKKKNIQIIEQDWQDWFESINALDAAATT